VAFFGCEKSKKDPSIVTRGVRSSPLGKATGADGLQEAKCASEIPRQTVESGWSKDQLEGMQREDQIPRIGRVTEESTIGEWYGRSCKTHAMG
jgi:hypothetical protein